MEKIYERPAGGRMIADVVKKHPGKNHPRILFTHDTMGLFRLNMENNPFMKARWEILKAAADRLLEQPPLKYRKIRHRLLPTCREEDTVIFTLAIAYQVTGDSVYADRLWEEVYQCCVVWPNWNPYHFLDTGVMALCVAVAYDWLYDYWTDEQKQIMEKAMMERAIKTTLEEYLDLPRVRAHGPTEVISWTHHNNWSFVCSGGVMAAALAICDEKPEYLERCAVMMGMGIQEVEDVLATYAPDGGYIEGPSYWGFANEYFALMTMALLSAAGSDYGLLKTPGLDRTAFFNYDMLGPGGGFNFSDAPAGRPIYPVSMWFAKMFQTPAIVDMYVKLKQYPQEVPLQTTIYEVLFYPPELEGVQYTPKCESYYRRVETVTIRDSWDMEKANFIGLHAGENGIAHYHMDCGSFILDMNGKRFALDLGAGTYNEPGLWWRYRYSAQGHNTWVINPGQELTQNEKAKTDIISFQHNEQNAFAIADITDAYVRDAEKLHRGVYAAQGRKVFVVQDELKLKKPSEAYWQMHTEAQIEILPGGKQAVLTLEDDQVLVTLLTDNNAVFEVRKAFPYEGTPYYPVSNNDEKTPKLVLHFTDTTEETVAVEFRHFAKGEPVPQAHLQVQPLSMWSV